MINFKKRGTWLDFGLNPIKNVLNKNGIKAEKFSGEMSQLEKKKLVENN